MLRYRFLPFVVVASLSGWVMAAPVEPKATPTPAPKATPSAKKTPKRAFTNDDLEAGREKPSPVQDLSATGATMPPPYEPAVTQENTPPEEAAQGGDTPTDAARIEEAEANVKALDAQAKELLWAYLQSTDSNEILRLKAEQQEVLDRLEAAKADLARLKGQATGSSGPAPEPTRPPG